MTIMNNSNEQLIRLSREFARNVRQLFEHTDFEGRSTLIVDRVVAAAAAATAAVLVVLPIKGMDKWVGVLIAASARLWSRKGQ